MNIGISTACFYPQYTEEALEEIARYRPQAVEVFINAQIELDDKYLLEIKKRADMHNIEIISLHPYTSGLEPMYFFSTYDRRFQEGLEVYKRFYNAANLLGAEIVVFHGALRNAKMSRLEYFERFHRVWELGGKYNVELCQENVQRCMSYTPEFFIEMSRALPQVGYVYDIKQAFRAGEDVYEFAKKLGARIRHVHISDHSMNQDCLVPGKGILNISKLVSIITKNDFDGTLIVELYRENFENAVEIFEGYQHLCTVLSTIQ